MNTKLKKLVEEKCGKPLHPSKGSEIPQEELAQSLGVSGSALSKYVSGTREPGLITKLRINSYFGQMVYAIDLKTVELCQSVRGLIGKED